MFGWIWYFDAIYSRKAKKGSFQLFWEQFCGEEIFWNPFVWVRNGGIVATRSPSIPPCHWDASRGSSNSTWHNNLVWWMSSSVIMSSRPSSSVIISWYDYRWLYQSANDAIFTNYMFQLWHLFLASSWYLTMRWGTNFLVVLPKSGVWGSTSGERIVTTSNRFHLHCVQNHVPKTNLIISMFPEPI